MSLRTVEPLPLPEGWSPAEPEAFEPRFEWIEPTSLLIDPKYQRNLTEASVRLIHRIAAGWSWRRFKPPIVAETDAGLHILDGQHTAIGAASHGGIPKIPVMIVEGADQLERARAFLGHNRDRVGLTALSLFHAAVAAGDESAQTVMQVCGRAGVVVFPSVSASDIHPYGYGDVFDFLDAGGNLGACDWMITNPPFNAAVAFARQGLALARCGIALLVRTQWLHTIERWKLFHEHPPFLIAYYVERVPMHRGRWEPDGDTATDYAWVCWKHGAEPRAPLWIPPGRRNVFTMPTDAARFAKPAPAPLLDGAA